MDRHKHSFDPEPQGASPVLVGLLGSIHSHTTEQNLKGHGECVRLMFSLERFIDNLHFLIGGHHKLFVLSFDTPLTL
jgi:hypothetical protein